MAISRLGCDLLYANNNFKDNKTIVEIAVKSTPFAYRYVSDRLKDDEELLIQALNGRSGGYMYKFTSERLKMKKNIVLLAIKKEKKIFYCIPDELFNNRECMLSIYSISCLMYEYIEWIPEVHKNDKEIIMTILNANTSPAWGKILPHISDELKDDYDFMLNIIKKNNYYIKHTSERLQEKFKEEDSNKKK